MKAPAEVPVAVLFELDARPRKKPRLDKHPELNAKVTFVCRREDVRALALYMYDRAKLVLSEAP